MATFPSNSVLCCNAKDACENKRNSTVEYDARSRKDSSGNLIALDKYADVQKSDNVNEIEPKMFEEDSCDRNNNAKNAIPCLTTEYSTTNATETVRNSETNFSNSDERIITEDQLRAKICDNKKLSLQQDELYKTLIKYRHFLTKRPGRCTTFEYDFKIEGSMPSSANTRSIPFALRNEVRDQIQAMVKDGIFESFSNYVNPLTFVTRENKPLRICVDARRINKQMVADRAKTLPMRELLQKFHGSCYITTIDLSKAFWQIPLKESSRKWRAFQFQSKVYQFTCVPYEFKNSLSAFIRSLDTVLGDDAIHDNVVMYVDDILIHSLNLLTI
jgi:hypothetical protein